MGDREMLEWLLEQLDIKMGEIYQAEDEREELRKDLEQTYNEIVAKRVQLREKDYDLEQMREDAKRIYKDIESLLGT